MASNDLFFLNSLVNSIYRPANIFKSISAVFICSDYFSFCIRANICICTKYWNLYCCFFFVFMLTGLLSFCVKDIFVLLRERKKEVNSKRWIVGEKSDQDQGILFYSLV